MTWSAPALLAVLSVLSVAAAAQDESLPAAFDRATLTAMVLDPLDPQRVYAGTMGWGLVVSDDGGRTWSATAPELGGRHVQSIAVHPLVADLVVVSTLRQGVWLSADGGRSFRAILTDLPEKDVPGVSLSVELDAEADDERRRQVEARLRRAGRSAPTQPEAGGVVVWALQRVRGPVRAGSPPPERDPIVGRLQPFHDISVHPVRPGEVLVAGRGRVARSEDGGATWTQVLDPGEPRFQASSYFLRGVDPAACTQTPLRFYRQTLQPDLVWVAACYGLFHSRDGGRSWSILPLGGFGRVLAVSADPADPNGLAASTDLGLLRSRDGGATWELLRAAAPGTPFGAVIMKPGGVLLAGGFGGEVIEADADGVVDVRRLRQLQATQRTDPEEEARRRALRSTPPYDRAGLAARPEAEPGLRPGIDLHVADLEVHPNFPDHLFAGTRRGVFVSEDGGETWRSSSLGLGELEVADVLADASAALLDPAQPDPAGERIMLWAATRGGGIYRSTSTGRAWQPASTGLADGNVRVLLQDRFEPHVLWAGTADDGVYRSVDAGEHWAPASDGLGELGIRVLVQSGVELLAATDHGDLYHSLDGGDSWQQRPGGLRRQPADSEEDLQRFAQLGLDPGHMHVHDLLADPDDPERLIAASSFGVFLSDDGGESWTWSQLRRGVARLARDPFEEDDVFAATTRGLWWSEDGGTTWRQAEFGPALDDLDPSGVDLDPAQGIRAVPPLFALSVLPGRDVLAGTDRGEVVRGSTDYGGWRVARLAEPGRIGSPKSGPAARPQSEAPTGEALDRYEALRTRRDAVLLAAAVASEPSRHQGKPRRNALLALEARRRGEVPDYPEELLEGVSDTLRRELEREDAATRVLRLADGDLRALQGAQRDGWGVDDVRFGPEGRYLAVQSSVDDGRSSRSEVRVYDLERRFLLGETAFPRQGPTVNWKVLHDLDRKPQSAHPDWLLEDTGSVLQWYRSELLVTRPADDRLALWRLAARPWSPAATSEVQAATIRGFPLPVQAVSVSEDGKWLGAVDSAGAAYVVALTRSREPRRVVVPVPPGEEPRDAVYQQIHVTARQLLLLGEDGITAYALGPDGPILETSGIGVDTGQRLFGASAGFSGLVADRGGRWLVALPAAADEAVQSLVFVAFQGGIAIEAEELDSATRSGWRATVSARQEWLAVHRSAPGYSESALYDLRGDLLESGPRLFFRVEGARDLRFGAGSRHVYFRDESEEQVWTLEGPSPKRLLVGVPDLHRLETEFESESPPALAAWFFDDEPRRADAALWAQPDRHRTLSAASPDGRWLAVAGPGRLLKLWHFDDEMGTLAPWTGTTLLDLSRYRAYPSSFPSSLDAWPLVEPRRGEPGSGELWQQACSIAGRNLDEAEWQYLFGDEEWQPTCRFE